MKTINRRQALGIMASAAGVVAGGAIGTRRADAAPVTHARVVAVDIPGASAIAEIGTFLNDPSACARPIPTSFPSYIQPGAILDPKRILVGSQSNFGARSRLASVRRERFCPSTRPGSQILHVPANFARSGGQASALGGFVQMFSANSPFWLNSVYNPGASASTCFCRNFTGVHFSKPSQHDPRPPRFASQPAMQIGRI